MMFVKGTTWKDFTENCPNLRMFSYYDIMSDERNLENLAAWNLYHPELTKAVANICTAMKQDNLSKILSMDANFRVALHSALLNFRKDHVNFYLNSREG